MTAHAVILDGCSRPCRCGLIIGSIAALIWLLAARVSGPSDLWDQTQPKTIAYTTDIIVNGGSHWILPIERGELPATKPPLYNWLAVPWVALLGFDSEIGHKMPSVAALLACWAIIVRLGRKIGQVTHQDESLGWLAGMILCANYAIFKLGYLARPDMLLTLWLLIAWASATRAYVDAASATTVNAALFWAAVTLAALTKGPAGLIAVAYAVLAARFVAGRWGAIRGLHPIIGLSIALSICGAWAFSVWRIDSHHLTHELWFQEIYGRVTGVGREGTHHGTREWLRELPYQGAYYMTRFAPWSFLSLIALASLGYAKWRHRGAGHVDPTKAHARRWAWAAALFALVTVGLFTLSIGKRPDYVAVAIPQASLLVAWFWLAAWPRIGVHVPWLAPVAAAVTLAAATAYNQRESTAPSPGFGDAIIGFARTARATIAADPSLAHAPVYAVSAGGSPVQTLIGIGGADVRHRLLEIIAQGEPFWVVAGRTAAAPSEFGQWMAHRKMPAEATEVARSADLPRAQGWPTQITLWRVTPGMPTARASNAQPAGGAE